MGTGRVLEGQQGGPDLEPGRSIGGREPGPEKTCRAGVPVNEREAGFGGGPRALGRPFRHDQKSSDENSHCHGPCPEL